MGCCKIKEVETLVWLCCKMLVLEKIVTFRYLEACHGKSS